MKTAKWIFFKISPKNVYIFTYIVQPLKCDAILYVQYIALFFCNELLAVVERCIQGQEIETFDGAWSLAWYKLFHANNKSRVLFLGVNVIKASYLT